MMLYFMSLVDSANIASKEPRIRMLKTTYDKQQSKSATLPVSQFTKTKTMSLTSDDCIRYLINKLSIRNLSSGFKAKVPRHLQDRESDVLYTSCGQRNARESGNFQQGHRKQRKIQESVWATKSWSYKRRNINRQQPRATLESEKEKLETEEDKLVNHRNDPDHNVDTVWYKGLWWAVKKQAKKIANSNADADSSSDESVSFDSHDTRRPSDSTGNNFEKLVSNENLAIRSSKGVQVNHESQKRDKRDKKEPSVQASIILDKNCIYTHPLTPAVSSYHSIPNQGREVTKLRPEQILSPLLNNSKMFLPEELRKSFIKRLKSIHSENSNKEERCNTQVNEKENKDEEKEEVAENLQENGENLVSSQNLYIPTTQDQRQDENSNKEERCNTQVNEKENEDEENEEVAENLEKNGENLVTSQDLDIPTTQDQIQDEKMFLPEELRKSFIKRLKSIHSENSITHFKLLVDRMTTSEKTGEKPEEDFKLLAYSRTSIEKIEKLVEINVLLEEVRRNFFNRSKSKHSKNGNNEERCDTQEHVNENNNEGKEVVEENHEENEENLVTSQNLDMPTTQDKIQDEINVLPEEVRRNFINRSKSIHSELKNEAADKRTFDFHGTKRPSNSTKNKFEEHSVSNKNLASQRSKGAEVKSESQKRDKYPGINQRFHNPSTILESKCVNKMTPSVSSDVSIPNQINDLPEVVRKEINNKSKQRHESTEASEGSTNRPIHPVDRRTTYNSQENNRIRMRGSMRNKILYKVQDEPSSEVNTYISSVESWATIESTLIRLYRNVIRNETSRMISSIDMVGFEAEHLFGLERSRIFFDLLDEELCRFESAGAISEFVPNMAESTVRQHVISFFEHAYDMISRLMTLLSCPDSKILQQMPVQNFISLMKSVIKFSLKAQTKGREKLSLEGNIYTMVDPKDFERSLGEEIPEYILNSLRNEDEIFVHKFVDTRLERHQPSDREENRGICSIYFPTYFPSDCRLFIYIPTLNGSYWHESDVLRAYRIHRHSR